MSKHPALKFPVEARVDYAMLVASIAVIDGAMNVVEAQDLEMLCDQLDLPDAETKRVLAYGAHPDTGHTANLFTHILGSELRFALIIDLVVSAMADGRYSEAEKKRVRSLASRLKIDDAQTKAIEQKVLTSAKRRVSKVEISEIAHDPDPLAGSLLGATVPTLAAVVVPLLALALATPGVTGRILGGNPAADEVDVLAVGGEILAGITTLGLGFGPAAGVVLAFLLSLVSYAGTRLAIARAFPDVR